MLTKEEINQKYADIHAELTKQYYQDHVINEAEFKGAHTNCWRDLQQELFDNGYLVRKWRYLFSATITTEVGDFELVVSVESPIQLTAEKIANNIAKIKNADWQLAEEESLFVEA